MVSLKTLVDYTDTLLSPERYSDYCPNGLQVEGRAEIRSIVSGVTASQALIEAATEAGADALLVHHGYFWKGEDARITGMKRRRLERLLGSGISLLAYHLPLDAHPELPGRGLSLFQSQRRRRTAVGRWGSAYQPVVRPIADHPRRRCVPIRRGAHNPAGIL